MNNNARNPYRSAQSRSRDPYASNASRTAGTRTGNASNSSGANTVSRSGSRNPYSNSGRTAAQQPQRARNPYAAGSARPAGTGAAKKAQAAQPAFRLNSRGKIVLLVLIILAVFLVVFGFTRLLGGGKPASDAIVPTLGTTEPTAEPTTEPTAEPAQTAEPSAVPAATDVPTAADPQPVKTATGLRSATIRSIGDFVIHEAVFKSAKLDDNSYDFTPMLTYIKDTIADADYTVANVDGPMGGAGKRGYKGYPQFNTPPHLMMNLKDLGVDMLTLANNHALDTYFDGLKAEIEACISIGMDYVGAARTQEEDDTPVIIDINGIKVGFLNYTHSTNTMEKYSDEAAKVYGLDIARFADFEADAQAARSAGAEVLVAYMHWGEEYERNPGSEQQYYGPKLVAAGVDVIIGGHPHMVQPCYWLEGTRTSDGGYQRTLCLSSLGNFLSDQRSRYRDSGIVFDFTIQEVAPGEFEIVNPTYIPTYVWRTGSESAGYEYRVVPCGPYLNKAPDGMDDESHARLVEAWYEIIEHMNTGTATCAVQEK